MNFLSRQTAIISALLFLCVSAPRWQTIAPLEKLIDAGRLPEAREELKRLISTQGETPATRYLEAKLLFRERKFTESLSRLEPLLQTAGQFRAEANKLAGLNYVLLDRLDLAEPWLKTAVELAPKDHLAHFHLGMLYYSTSRFSAAADKFGQTIKLQPAFANGYDGLGLASEELGNEEASIKAYRQAIELTEEQKLRDGSPYLNLGKFLLTKNRFDESARLLQRAAQLNPNSAEAFFLLGKALSKSGQESEAVKTLLRSIQLDPNFAEAHYLLSRIYLDQGRREEAQREMQIFQELRNRKTKQ